MLIITVFFLPVAGNVYNLFAFPSECNFSGQKFPLDLVKVIKEDGGKILGVPSHQRYDLVN